VGKAAAGPVFLPLGLLSAIPKEQPLEKRTLA